LPSEVQYKADVENGGLAKAYNYALEIAQKEGFDWLLTLDQDTSLPIDFLCKLCHAVAFVAPLNTVAAIVPICGGRAGSPWIRRKYWIRPKRFPDGFIGIPLESVYAVNSASTIRVSALKAIGGYDPRFYLWASDLVMYHRLHCNHFSIFVAGNIHVEHESSIADLKNRSTPNRYEDMLRAEEAFYDEYMGRRGHIVLLLMMFHRLFCRLWTTGGSLPYFIVALRFLCRGLFYSRKRRMESWKQSVRRC
jgi:GT2 family glycosyltransferase